MSATSRERAAPTAGPDTDRERLASAFVAWRETLTSVKKSVDEATAAVGLLRTTLHEMAPLWRSLGQLEKALASVDWAEAMNEVAEVEESLAKATSPQPQTLAVPEETAAPEEPDLELAREPAHTFSGRGQPLARLDVPTLDGGAPYSYTVTVEEVGSRVKLVPLHQSLSQVEGVRELSLKSYTNGVAVVSVDSEVELAAPALEEAITAGMHKACRVTPGDGPSFLARMGDNPASDERHQQESAA